MADQSWPSPTPRDEMLARVVTRGRRIRMINRALIGLAVGGVATAGAIGLALGFSGTVSLVGAPASVSMSSGGLNYFACPNQGAMGEFLGGDRVYLTGRDDSGDWVQVRSPEHQDQRVWIRAEHVDPDEQVDLELAGCNAAVGEFEVAEGTTTTSTSVVEPVETTEPVDPNETTTTTAPATTTTTQPGQTTTTTQPPATTTTTAPTTTTTAPTTTTTTQPAPVAPTFGAVQRGNAVIKEDFSDGCGTPHKTSLITTTVSHPSGTATTQFRTRVGNGPWGSWQTVSTQTGSVSGLIGPYPTDTLPPYSSAEIAWEFRAIAPNGGPTATLASTPNSTVTLNWCSVA